MDEATYIPRESVDSDPIHLSASSVVSWMANKTLVDINKYWGFQRSLRKLGFYALKFSGI